MQTQSKETNGLTAPDLQGFLRSRRSVRRFLPQIVSQAVLERILETATWSPSAHNRQPWRYVVLTGDSQKARLAEAMGVEFRRALTAGGQTEEDIQAQVERSHARITQAPVAVVLCLDTLEMDEYADPVRQQGEQTMGVQSVALSGGTLLLAAHAEGLGGVWVCSPLFAPQAVRQALGLPQAWMAQGMILLGYPAAIPGPRPRRPLGEVAVFL